MTKHESVVPVKFAFYSFDIGLDNTPTNRQPAKQSITIMPISVQTKSKWISAMKKASMSKPTQGSPNGIPYAGKHIDESETCWHIGRMKPKYYLCIHNP